MIHASEPGKTSARILIHSAEYQDAGVCVVLKTKPLTVLVPSHVCVAIEQGYVQGVTVDSAEYRGFRILPTLFLEREHLSILQFDEPAQSDLHPIRLSRVAEKLRPGMDLHCGLQGEAGIVRQVRGSLTELLDEGVETTLFTDIPISPGDSGSPLLSDGRLVGISVGMRSKDGEGHAVGVPLSPAVLQELRRIVFRTRRRVAIFVASVLVVALIGLVARSWTTFELASVEGPLNLVTSTDDEYYTITATNGQVLSLRRTWKRTFETPIRWWIQFSDRAGEEPNFIAVGTQIKDGASGYVTLLDSSGRTRWRYTVPDGECIYTGEEVFNGFHPYRVFTADLTGDGQTEVIASFVHEVWYPCKIVVFDLDGTILGEYWHPGYLRTFAAGVVGEDFTPMFLLTGSNNRFRGDAPYNPQGLMAFRGANLSGQAPPYTGIGEQGNEAWYYLIQNMDDDHRTKCVDIRIIDTDGDGDNEIVARLGDDRFYYLDENGTVLHTDLGDEFLKEFGYVDEVPELIWVDLGVDSYEPMNGY